MIKNVNKINDKSDFLKIKILTWVICNLDNKKVKIWKKTRSLFKLIRFYILMSLKSILYNFVNFYLF